MVKTQTNLIQADYNAESLRHIIIGLKNSIKTIEAIYSFDGIWLLEKSEPVFGMAFIAFQNYINTSIKDLFDSTANKITYYKIGPRLERFERSNAELIIGLANYLKHKDEGKLHSGTKNILNAFNLETSEMIEESPIFKGLDILDEKWDLIKIYEMIIDWRKELFALYLKESP
ncbi:hypothetical protein [Brumimicrobium aurantiacum]|uniref:Uncharacterized protein n=1 Tax=Brumimicrobium aurantiacum TaxID=1737063 RepID=A0A3E1EUI1_9FLAO|nr:hypothetical protein [Brumimicrobium aurantiacum]RFC53190.1 hypothetical protein DXU93_14060 [Brumimicrobium aurantiacum]